MSHTSIENEIAAPHEICGPHDAPAILALGGISASRHVCATPDNPALGWWEIVAGPHRALDTTRYRLIGCGFVDGGETPDGRPARVVTTHDQSDAIAAALDEAGVERLHAIVGASYGGMVALAFAERYRDRLDNLVVIGAAHRSSPMTTALRSIQRRIVELGLETDRERDALALARMLAVTTYRTASEFEERFTGAPEIVANDIVFPVERYLAAHGDRFASAWTASRYLALSLSMDLHAVDPSRIMTPTTLVAAEGDANVPRELIVELHRSLGGQSRLVDLPTKRGHDGFLTEAIPLSRILSDALDHRSTTSTPKSDFVRHTGNAS